MWIAVSERDAERLLIMGGVMGDRRLLDGRSRTMTKVMPHKWKSRLSFDMLEDRVVPAPVVWSGAAGATTGDFGWTNPGNWVGNAAPEEGDEIVFGSAKSSSDRKSVV